MEFERQSVDEPKGTEAATASRQQTEPHGTYAVEVGTAISAQAAQSGPGVHLRRPLQSAMAGLPDIGDHDHGFDLQATDIGPTDVCLLADHFKWDQSASLLLLIYLEHDLPDERYNGRRKGRVWPSGQRLVTCFKRNEKTYTRAKAQLLSLGIIEDLDSRGGTNSDGTGRPAQVGIRYDVILAARAEARQHPSSEGKLAKSPHHDTKPPRHGGTNPKLKSQRDQIPSSILPAAANGEPGNARPEEEGAKGKLPPEKQSNADVSTADDLRMLTELGMFELLGMKDPRSKHPAAVAAKEALRRLLCRVDQATRERRVTAFRRHFDEQSEHELRWPAAVAAVQDVFADEAAASKAATTKLPEDNGQWLARMCAQGKAGSRND